MNRRLAGFALALAVLLADQLSKYWVLHAAHLTDGHVLKILPVLDFVLLWNHGITFGILNGNGGITWVILASSPASPPGSGPQNTSPPHSPSAPSPAAPSATSQTACTTARWWTSSRPISAPTPSTSSTSAIPPSSAASPC